MTEAQRCVCEVTLKKLFDNCVNNYKALDGTRRAAVDLNTTACCDLDL